MDSAASTVLRSRREPFMGLLDRKPRFPLRAAYDRELADICALAPSHHFLVNPTCHSCHTYLANYISTFAVRHFGRRAKDIHMLDWGCGPGQWTYLLRKSGFQVTACDLARPVQNSAFNGPNPITERFGIEVVPLVSDIILPFASRSFDAVLSMGVLEHVRDERASLAEISRVLIPGGLFFCFYLPFTGSWTQFVAHRLGNHYHDRLYTKRQAKRLISESGFEVLDIWHRQLFPKRKIRYPWPAAFETLDRILVAMTPLRFFSTNIEFVAVKH